ncbi:MAG TPA: BatD family protein [Steroidobacteraceae bacterium]|nr:BatD family protein [Steroidobacteraceae bacterium]
MSLRAGSRKVLVVMALALLAAAPSMPARSAVTATAPSVNASIEPNQISVGESARLTILMSGRGTLSVSLPVVPGLEFRVVGQSRQIQIINGITLESTSTIVRVTPQEPGVFTIPGLTPNSPPLVLRVSPSGSRPPAPGTGAAPGAAPLIPGGAGASGMHLTPDGSAFVHLEMPKHEIYVGESVPVEVQVGMRDGFVESLNGLPKLNSNDFTLNNLSRQPERGPRTIDGKPFTVYTWRSLLAAVKPGTFSLSFETPLTVRIRTRPARESMLDDLLGDPFLQNIFGATVQKNITAASPAAEITVLPLPAQGRPPDFGGAVGSFKISTDVSSARNTQGDPLTLRLHVSGDGNFDRVETSMLGGDAQWKTYEPKATFKSTDPTGFRGEKTFEQPIIATQSGSRIIPPLVFSYFNPATRRYETAHSSPLSVTVSPAPSSPESEPPPTLAGTAAADRNGLRPDHAVTEARAASLVPPYFRPLFAGGVSIVALVFGGGWAALRRRERNANDIQRERQRLRLQLIHELLEAMASSSSAADTAVFFRSARSALQQGLSARWDLAPELITLEDIEARLQGADRDEVRQIFLLADEANYSGADLKAADFEHWTQAVRRHLAAEVPG